LLFFQWFLADAVLFGLKGSGDGIDGKGVHGDLGFMDDGMMMPWKSKLLCPD
jgi:hypothetical protein